jgi:hypothetical protein
MARGRSGTAATVTPPGTTTDVSLTWAVYCEYRTTGVGTIQARNMEWTTGMWS